MNEETRGYTEIAAECERLEKELKDVKVKLGLAVIVNTDLQKEKLARLDDDYLMIDNRDLHKQLAQARNTIADYQRAHAVAEVDVEFGRFMFKCGYGYTEMDMSTESIDPLYEHATEVWENFQGWKADQK